MGRMRTEKYSDLEWPWCEGERHVGLSYDGADVSLR